MTTLSRRGLLATGVLGASTGVGSADAVGADPRTTAVGQVKLNATLDGSAAYWSYSGVVYAVSSGVRPRAILTLAACQSTWAAQAPDGGYRIAGAIATFFRDPVTGAFLDSFENPLTNARNKVEANFLSGGVLVYPPDGSSAHLEGAVTAGVVTPKGFGANDPAKASGAVRWNVLGPCVMLMTDHAWNVAVQPQLEAQTQIGDRAAFFDPSVRRMPASFTATTIVPWMRWMEMGDAPGHLVWHSSGQKLFSIDASPADYRARAGSHLDLLSTRPAHL